MATLKIRQGVSDVIRYLAGLTRDGFVVGQGTVTGGFKRQRQATLAVVEARGHLDLGIDAESLHRGIRGKSYASGCFEAKKV